jgi:hypothetical protein
MRHSSTVTFRVLLLLALPAYGALAQAMPTAQARYINIYREQIKVGHDAAHARTEAAWVAALEKAKSPATYLALASTTGVPEVWFVEAFDTYSALGNARDMNSANALLSAELELISPADAAHIDAARTIEARGRPDLSHGAYPNLSLQRHWEITVFRVRPGFEPMFADVVKMYKGLVTRANSKASWRFYEVTAGMLGPAYILFMSVDNYAGFDASMADGMALQAKMTAEEGALWTRFGREGLISSEANRYSLSAGMSFVTAETRASDPKFWMKK